jgi:chromosome segregation ATPase
MKVIVRCANNRVTKADMEREIERLFQENKDLRLSESHLRDEVNILRQQSEVRRQVICERDKLIQELNDQIAADEEELANAKASVEIQRGFREEMAEEIEALEKELAKSESESSQGMNAMVKFWEEAVNEKNKAEERAEEYRIALMESDCRVAELEKQVEWLQTKNKELEAQKEADDKKCEETCTACNELYEDVLSDRNHLREEVVLLTNERDTAVHENTEMMFDINELQDKWEAEHNLRVEAEKAYDKVASEAYDMHQQITNLTIDNTRLESQVEELKTEVDTCHFNIDGYIEGNRRMRAEYEKKLEAEQNQTKHWRKKYEELMEEHNELEADYDTLVQTKREYGEEIDRLRKVVVELQTNRFTTDEFIGMLVKNFMPSADK